MRDNKYVPASGGDKSTHIAKFLSLSHSDLIVNEYLTMMAFKSLLPEDVIAEVSIAEVVGICEPALIVKRFDRIETGSIHFEEFNQLLGRFSLKNIMVLTKK